MAYVKHVINNLNFFCVCVCVFFFFLFFFLQIQIITSKFHGEFMSPALFLFEVLKMVKLTRGPLVLYQLPKY